MPRILRILNRFNLGGPTYNAAYLTKYMPDAYETLLVGGMNDPSEKNSEFIVNQLGIQPLVIRQMRREISPLKDFRAYDEIGRIIKEFKPHIVHTHASKAGALGRLAAIRHGVPVVVHTFHGHVFDAYFNQYKASVYKNIERFLAKRSSGIIAISENQKTDLAEKYKICNPDKIRVIPLGFELDHFRENQEENRRVFREKYQLDDHEIALGIVGRVVPIKNHLMFLKALKIIQEQGRVRVRAFIIGDGESRQVIERSASQMGLDHTFWPKEGRRADLTFTGWITRMDQVNAGLDIVALTSLSEGTPVNLIEAQAAGKPVVSTQVGGVENVVIPGHTALLVEKNDHESMAEKISTLAANHDLRKEFSQRGWEHVIGKYHFTRLISDMTDYYEELLENSQVSR
jgi:glycosyltransferase involved in cell wall biosynthesis